MPRDAIVEDRASVLVEHVGTLREDAAAVDRARRRGEGVPDGQGRLPRAARRRPLDRHGRDGRGRRPVREREDDDPEPDHGDRPADGRDGDGRRASARRDERGGAGRLARRERRRRLPVLPAAADAVGARERRAAARLRAPRLEARALRAGAAQPRARRARRQGSTTCRPSSRAASSSGSRSRARSHPIRSSSSATSRPATSTRVTAAEMFELLERLNDEGKTILYVTHDLELARTGAPDRHDPRRRSSSREARAWSRRSRASRSPT